MKTLLLNLSLITSLLMFPVCAKHKISDLDVSKAFVRPTTHSGMSSAGYMTFTNNGDNDDTLISIQSDSVSKIEIHETKIDDNGVMSMRPITDGIVIPAKQSVVFKPRGLHLMLIDIKYPLVTETQIPIILSFKNSRTQKINVNIANQVNSETCH